ncbi:PilN domain-containing protein [Caenimonas sedimenti]|uniref:PilN domain-containing protein n=1 Tax=Caenimonas sedimenti TaxID=2596921 RepID=A0A562ZPF2_9BURK|nr:PilN domain-containing protein [Caenimonas sedimenti]TWO70459.1 PilN domain-containing protein [Caenimonas sedimenti]
MILINLLPHREAARKRRREAFFAALGMSAFVGVLIAGGIYLWYAAQISNQQGRNMVLTNEIKRLEAQIKDIATLQAEIAALRARQQAVEDLQADRNVPVHLLSELVKQLPDGIYLTSMRQAGDTVTLSGVAQSQERVSELLRNLSGGSAWLARPELVEIVAGNVALAPRDTRRIANFSMRVKLLRAAEAQKAAAAAASAAGVAPAAGAAMPAASGPMAAGSAPVAVTAQAGASGPATPVAAAVVPASAKK